MHKVVLLANVFHSKHNQIIRKLSLSTYLGDGRVGRPGGDEGDGGGGGVVGHHRLLDRRLHVRDVPQRAHCAHSCKLC